MVDVGSLSSMIDQVNLPLTCLAAGVLLSPQHDVHLRKVVTDLCISALPQSLQSCLQHVTRFLLAVYGLPCTSLR